MSPVHYDATSLGQPGINEQIADRGREAGQALGPDPATSVRSLGAQTLSALEGFEDELIVGTPFGGFRLVDYLPTRVLELVVHTLDLTRATSVDAQPPQAALQLTLGLLFDLAREQGQAGDLVLALTGRTSLPEGYTVLS